MKKNLLLFAFLFLTFISYGQIQNAVGVGAGFSTGGLNTTAIMEARSTTKGFLPPRMTMTQRLAITSPAFGLEVTQTDGAKGKYYFDGTNWQLLSVGDWDLQRVFDAGNIAFGDFGYVQFDLNSPAIDFSLSDSGTAENTSFVQVPQSIEMTSSNSSGNVSLKLENAAYQITSSNGANQTIENAVTPTNDTTISTPAPNVDGQYYKAVSGSVNGGTKVKADSTGNIDLTISTSGNTNLSTTQSPTNVVINSDTGTDATIILGNGTNAGVSTNDYTNIEKYNLEEWRRLGWSAGAISGFAFTNNGNGTANIASGFAVLRTTAMASGTLNEYNISGVTNQAFMDNATNYVYADYNGGTPTISVTTNSTLINTQTTTLMYVVVRQGTNLYYQNTIEQNVDSNGKLRRRFLLSERFAYGNGVIISNPATRKIAVTTGTLFSGLTPITIPAFNTNVSDTFTYTYFNGINYTRTTGQTDINNTQYISSGTLTTMTNNRFRTDFVYLLVDNPTQLWVVQGDAQYNSLAEAKAAPVPTNLPPELTGLGVSVGRIIIEKNATTLADVASPFTAAFIAGTATNHNQLGGLQGGTMNEYYHLNATQYSYYDPTSSIQGQLNAKKSIATGNNYKWETTGATGNLQETTVTASRAVATDSNGLPVASATTATELGYVNGVTSSIQTQLNTKLDSSTAASTYQPIGSYATLTGTETLSNKTLPGFTLTGNITGAINGSSSILAGSTSTIGIGSRSRFSSNANGNMLVSNAASSGFNSFFFGQATSSFPALNVNSTKMEFMLGDLSQNTTIKVAGLESGYVAKTAAYTAGIYDYTVDCTTGTFTVTLPSAVGIAGHIFVVNNSGTGVITVSTTSSQTIDGSTTKLLATQNSNVTVQSNGANYIILSTK